MWHDATRRDAPDTETETETTGQHGMVNKPPNGPSSARDTFQDTRASAVEALRRDKQTGWMYNTIMPILSFALSATASFLKAG